MPNSPLFARRGFTLVAGAALLPSSSLLVGCAVLGGNQTLTLGPRELEDLLARRFPLDRRLLEVFDVTVSTPRLALLPERNRLATVLEVSTRDRLFGNAWRGRLALDAGLRWEPADTTLRLQQVRVSEFSFDGAESLGRRDQAERLAALLAERVLEDFVIYRLSAERLEKLQRRGVLPGGVNVTSRGVEIRFAPVTP